MLFLSRGQRRYFVFTCRLTLHLFWLPQNALYRLVREAEDVFLGWNSLLRPACLVAEDHYALGTWKPFCYMSYDEALVALGLAK